MKHKTNEEIADNLCDGSTHLYGSILTALQAKDTALEDYKESVRGEIERQYKLTEEFMKERAFQYPFENCYDDILSSPLLSPKQTKL